MFDFLAFLATFVWGTRVEQPVASTASDDDNLVWGTFIK